ncbi:hypothetical protein D3C75_929060 [compost metagenome]
MVISLGHSAERVWQSLHGVVDITAKRVQLCQAGLVGAALHVDHSGAHATFLVQRTDVAGQAYSGFAHGCFADEGVLANDAGAAFRVEGDQFKTRLDVLGHVLHRGVAAPGDDLFQVLRLIQALFESLVATFPVSHAEMLGQRVLRSHLDHGAGDGQGSERVVGRRLDDRVAAQHHVADDGQQRQ